MFENEFALWEAPVLTARQTSYELKTKRPARKQSRSSNGFPIAMLGVSFDNLIIREAIRRIEEMIASRQPHYVATANVDFLVRARRDAELQRILLDAPLVLCDGTPLVWTSRLLGNALPERVAGADLVPELIRVAAKKNYKIFFLGTTEECCAQAITNVRQKYPNIEIDHYSPPFRKLLEMNNAEIFRRVRAAQPDILLVAFGCPKAEKWMAMHYRSLGVPVMIGVGATIDFLAGHVKRAPMWIQRSGFEWVYRLCQEPRRLLKRYVTDLWWFGGTMSLQWWKMRLQAGADRPASHSVIVMNERNWQRIEVSEHFNHESIRADAALWEEFAEKSGHCLLDLSNVKTIDSTGLGLLADLQKRIRATAHELVLISPSRPVREAIALMQWQDDFDIANDALEARALIAARQSDEEAVIVSTMPVFWQGEITSINAVQILQRTLDAMLRVTSEPLFIDLGAVRFMDSSGIKLMLRAKDYARRWKIRLRFRNASAAVLNVLRAEQLDYLIEQPA
jgi:N-acetylglucosaminyldiphosphoundecaprenol N-acetyl-beta-D-mannosaminyltransferase